MPASWLRSTTIASCCGWLRRRRGRQRHLDREARAASGHRAQVELVVEHARDALDDREAEAQAARHLGALVEPLEFAEDHALLGLRNAEAGVVDVDPQLAARAPAADQHAALRRVLHRVGDQVLQQPAQQAAVGAHAERAGHERRARGPFRAPAARTRPRAGAASRRSGSSTGSGRIAPASSREMSSSAPKISSTASSEASTLPISRRVLAARPGARSAT